MEQISLSEMMDRLAAFPPAVWVGAACAILIFIIEIRLCQKKIIFAEGEKKLAKAKSMGHVILGKRIRCTYQNRTPNSKAKNRMYVAYYEYQSEGMVRKKQVISTSVEPPTTVSFYYLKSPDKVFSVYDVGKNPAQLLLYIFPLAIAIIVMRLLGFPG